MTSSDSQLSAFIDRKNELLAREWVAEIERSILLLSNRSPKLLEQKGLALLGLGIRGVKIGLGGKTLVELERPSAYHTNPIFFPHMYTERDLARIEVNVTAKTKKQHHDITASTAEGVVYKVSDTRVVIVVDSEDEHHVLRRDAQYQLKRRLKSAYIHEPPVTGKTHTLIEIIRQLTSSSYGSPKRILVCGTSNLSVDNILERLFALPASHKSSRLK
ncbi:hypothetical protein BT96DRAFT_1000160 [Gymnopus androsaceus JB14]|uniref:DNA helicase n=1 Tax=Gymnopus androsaceus JB14 TaxID=1447944 RepID=A0A6A4H4L0_9AGAR|nr:hypothetical protein BT96DRAFT_1000160 [Gymnopus androsaceus JB14]